LRWNSIIFALSGCLALCWSADAAVSLTPLPFLPRALSGDGSIVYGISGTGSATPTLQKWTAATGAQTAFQFPASTLPTIWSVSNAGDIVVGTMRTTPNPAYPFIWSAANGLQTFPTLNQNIARTFVSGDGSTVYTDGYRLLPGPVTAVPNYALRAISNDGSIVGLGNAGGRAYRFVNGVTESLPIPGEPPTSTRITAITPDGLCLGATDSSLIYWQGNNLTTTPLKYLWQPAGVSDDGRVVVGHDHFTSSEAVIMIDGRQQRVRDYLVEQGVDVTGTTLLFSTAWDVSQDGTTFITTSNNNSKGFLVHIPEPASLALLVTPLVLSRSRRRRA
jgi:hypothetical protein